MSRNSFPSKALAGPLLSSRLLDRCRLPRKGPDSEAKKITDTTAKRAGRETRQGEGRLVPWLQSRRRPGSGARPLLRPGDVRAAGCRPGSFAVCTGARRQQTTLVCRQTGRDAAGYPERGWLGRKRRAGREQGRSEQVRKLTKFPGSMCRWATERGLMQERPEDARWHATRQQAGAPSRGRKCWIEQLGKCWFLFRLGSDWLPCWERIGSTAGHTEEAVDSRSRAVAEDANGANEPGSGSRARRCLVGR